MNFTITVSGTAPLIMHNGRLSDPLDPATKSLKAITGLRKKSDEDHEAMSRVEHAGGLYLDPDIGPYLPADNIWRALLDAAKKTKQGKTFQEAVIITTDVNPLSYNGPRDAAGLYADANFVFRKSVKNQMNRVMRTRPIFQTWSTSAEGVCDEALLNFRDLKEIAERAGAVIGLGDWRPRYGRFTAEVVAA